MQKIVPNLWYDGKAEEAARLYTSIFKNSSMGAITRYGEAAAKISGRPKGSVMTVSFKIEGQEFLALNGGPIFKFTEAVSFIVNCETQAEIDRLWQKLTEGGEESVCGWLKDKYGLSWQVTPTVLSKYLTDPDPVKAERVMQVFLQMKKIDISALKKAHEGR